MFTYLMNKRLLRLLLCCLVIAFVSCNNGKEQEEEQGRIDSISATESITKEDSTLFFNNDADAWLDLSLNNTHNAWNRFALDEFWYEDSIVTKPFKPDAGFYKNYAPLLKWSPDSNYILDIGSYGKILVKDKRGNVHIENGEIDSKASLINHQTNTIQELLFLGASGTILDGKWISNNQFSLLSTFDENNDNNPDTILWIVDVKENFYRKYKLK